MTDLTPETQDRLVKLARMIVNGIMDGHDDILTVAAENAAATEARAIVALLPPEKDPDLAVVREMVAVEFEEDGSSGVARSIRHRKFDDHRIITGRLAIYKLGKQHGAEGR